MVTMGAVWDRTSAFLIDNLGAVIAITLPLIYVPTVIDGVLGPATTTASQASKVGVALLSFLFSLVSVLGQTALIALALDPPAGRGRALSLATARIPAMIGVSLVLLLVLFVLCLPPVAIAAGGGMDLMNVSAQAMPNLAPGSALLIVLYMLILIPVVIWAGARLATLGAVVVAERLGLGAIRRSFALTAGFAARIIGVLLLFFVVAIVAELAAKTVFGSVFRLALGGEGQVNAAMVLTVLVVSIVSTGFTAVLACFSAKLYAALRDRADPVPAAA